MTKKVSVSMYIRDEELLEAYTDVVEELARIQAAQRAAEQPLAQAVEEQVTYLKRRKRHLRKRLLK